jgi:hypothetical protein
MANALTPSAIQNSVTLSPSDLDKILSKIERSKKKNFLEVLSIIFSILLPVILLYYTIQANKFDKENKKIEAKQRDADLFLSIWPKLYSDNSFERDAAALVIDSLSDRFSDKKMPVLLATILSKRDIVRGEVSLRKMVDNPKSTPELRKDAQKAIFDLKKEKRPLAEGDVPKKTLYDSGEQIPDRKIKKALEIADNFEIIRILVLSENKPVDELVIYAGRIAIPDNYSKFTYRVEIEDKSGNKDVIDFRINNQKEIIRK